MPISKYHVRSNSFPSQSHPNSTRIEQELTKTKTWESQGTPCHKLKKMFKHFGK